LILIPLKHENMQGRRWPIITFSLIILNVIAFLATHWTIEDQSRKFSPQRFEVAKHLLVLAATHPELTLTDYSRKFVEFISSQYPDDWKDLSSSTREAVDEWEENLRNTADPAALQTEMNNLSQQFESAQQSTIVGHYAFVPAHPSAISYLTANFLHGGWLHLIGNMWFLWLAGFILEDNWGRIIYSAFYLVAGAVALQFHGWMYPHSFIPLLGASGAVAALMGAFLVRFPKLKIEMFWAAFYIRGRFKAPAFYLIPIWGLMELFYGTLFGQASGVAHWAHVGGFLFGMGGAWVLQRSGLEQKASSAIDQKVGWTADSAVVEANELIEQGKLQEAVTKLRQHIAAKPDSADAYQILQTVCWRMNDPAGHQDASIKLCELHLRQHNKEAAWAAYEEFCNTGGEKLPPAVWLELCRYLEEVPNLDRAVSEYEKLAAAHSNTKQALLAQIAAGRLCLKRLNRPADALRFYQAAAQSPIPHLDWETNIQAGLKAAQEATEKTPVSA
jgi:membrane associated rhomboid family serine protease